MGPLAARCRRALRRPARPAADAPPPAGRGPIRLAGDPAGDAPGRTAGSPASRARALLAGLAAHSILPLEQRPTAGDRPGARRSPATPSAGRSSAAGRSGSPTRWRRTSVRSAARSSPAGGSSRSTSCRRLASILLDVTPAAGRPDRRRIACRRGYVRRLGRYRYGPGVFKVDWALDGPIPWRRPTLRRAGTVHLGGTLEEVAAAERRGRSRRAPRAAVRAARRSRACSTRPRAPPGKHTAWAYCHVPNGSTVDMTDRIEAPDRALRPRLPRPHPGAARHGARRTSSVQRQLHRRRHQRRRPGPAAVLHPAGGAASSPIRRPIRGLYHLLVVDAAGRRRARHVRLLRGAAAALGAIFGRCPRPLAAAASPSGL